MKAVIPCAEKEDSLYPLTESKPTGLLPVMGKPIVKHLIRDLQSVGVDDIYLVTNYKEEMFREEFEEFTNVNIVSQEELNGTGGAVETCNFIEEDFVVVNGDVITSETDLDNLFSKHEEKDSKTTILAETEDNPEKFGVLSIRNDKVETISEKPEDPENSLVNTGIYVFNPEIFDVLEDMDDEEKELTDAVEKMVDSNKTYFEMVENYWLDIGTLKKLRNADQTKRTYEITETEISASAEVHDEATILGNAIVSDNAVLKPGTVIEGDVFIGPNAVVGPNTSVVDSTVGADNQIRGDLEDTLMFESEIVDPSTFIENSIIGEESNIKSNTTIRESFIGPRSFVEMNNSIYGVKFVPDARTDISEISK